MLGTLIESKHKAKRYQLLGTGLLSLFVHTLLITGFVVATLQAGQPGNTKPVADSVIYLLPPQKPADPQPPQVDLPLGFPTIPVVTSTPKGIPPMDLHDTIDPQDFTGAGIEEGTPSGVLPGNGDVLTPDLVQRGQKCSHTPRSSIPSC